MEDLLVRERTVAQHVQYLLHDTEEPIDKLIAAFEEYRGVVQALIFADYENGAAAWEQKLWQLHGEGRKFFHKHLSLLRKQGNAVAVRSISKYFLTFLKGSERFYRQHIHQLNQAFEGIPELEAVADEVRGSVSSEGSQGLITPDLRRKALESCHQTLIYLGDLSRYRASEGLHRAPDFRPAIGYYMLACTLRPSSGLGYHQQAVIALEERQHLRGIYHLYRAIVVDEPHPNAALNLKKEFDRVNIAWDRGELIPKGGGNDPDASKNALSGWYVRLHSICLKGETSTGYDELEREVFGQLAAQIRQRDDMGGFVMRLAMTNISAQYIATEKFQDKQTQQNQNTFLNFFRLNIKTFTTLLRLLYDELKAVDLNVHDDEEDDAIRLATRLSTTARRLLSVIRVYSSWLLPMTHLMEGLATDDVLQGAIEQFWPIYAKSLDLVAALFPIWDLEDLTEVTYLLQEDVDTLGFKPLINDKTTTVWRDAKTGTEKLHYSDMRVKRLETEEEMLKRVKDFLITGLNLANDDESAPLKLQSTRILHRDAQDVEPLPMPVIPKKVALTAPNPASQVSKPAPPVKPLSYAAAATNGSKTMYSPAPTTNGSSASTSSNSARHAQMVRMVDDLVDDDESTIPGTPPQQYPTYPTIPQNGSTWQPVQSAFPYGPTTDYQQVGVRKPAGFTRITTPPTLRTPTDRASPANNTALKGLESVSSLWNDSSFPAGLPTGTLGSPAQFYSRGHSRVNSASSIRSRTSQGPVNATAALGESWSSLESAAGHPTLPNGGLGFDGTTIARPLLFGAGGGVWSASPQPPFGKVSPGNGQEG